MMSCNLFQENKATNELEAYLLGFIYADGTVLYDSSNKTRYTTMKIDLALKDESFLLKLNQFLNGKIYYYSTVLNNKKYPQIRLAVYDVNFVKRIIDIGVIPNKTYSESDYIFQNIPDCFKWHFIRGYFDGNGCVTVNKKGQANIEICSRNKIFLDSMHSYIAQFTSTRSNVTKGDGVWRIRYCGNRQVGKIASYLYNNCSIKLERKWKIISQVL